MLILKLLIESVFTAWDALRANLLRTLLSLLGVTVGIFAIITVFTLVDSLERNIRDSFSFLGDKVIRVEKWPWSFSDDYPWWKYYNRPYPTLDEYDYLVKRSKEARALTIFAEQRDLQLQYGNSSIDRVGLTGMSQDYNQVFDVEIAQGRFFAPQETALARNVAIIGSEVATTLFGSQNPLGNVVKLQGLQFTIIGVMAVQGESVINMPSADLACYIPYRSFLKLYASNSTRGVGSTIALRGREDDEGLVDLENEIIGLMRSRRALRPREEEDFAINRPEFLAEMVSTVFNVIGLAGAVIGSFSILVGGFGIANIMFVSVKERTHIIGIQKSLGAKNYFILLQFLFESIFLSLLGGVCGMILVYLATFIPLGSLDLVLTPKNVILGTVISSVIGIVSGVIPAVLASRLNPVEAIRS